MAGIGVKLDRIYSKNTITTSIIGFGYSVAVTIAPMLLVIAAVILMQFFLGYSRIGYISQELFSCTVLYVFIFALLTSSPFNSVLSKYLSDVIYFETYEDIMPCFYVGLFINVVLSSVVGILFCIREYLVGEVEILYVFLGYCCYMSLVLVFYSMLYLSIFKDYKKISFAFLVGMVISFLLSLFLAWVVKLEVIYSMTLALTVGFIIIACLEIALVSRYFTSNSGKYREVFRYFKENWQLSLANSFYILGLYIHNFVFWSTDMHMIVVKCFVGIPTYDMASCLAMFTNISASVIFISRIEMYFHDRYKAYSEAVIGGRGRDIERTKRMMFSQISAEMVNLVRVQFIISVAVFFIAMILLPRLGFGGQVLRIYPCLAAGYFILFIMYSVILILYYYNDMAGAILTSMAFCGCTFIGSLISCRLSSIWYGVGLVAGAFIGWCMSYYRLKRMEKKIDVHIFCNGRMLSRAKGVKPSSQVYARGDSQNISQGGSKGKG